MIKSLKYRILAWFIGIIFVIVSLFTLGVYVLLEHNINKATKDHFAHQALYIQKNILARLHEVDFDHDSILVGTEIAVFKDDEIIKQTKNFHVPNINTLIKDKKDFYLIDENSKSEDGVYLLHVKNPFVGVIAVLGKDIHREARDIAVILLICTPVLLLILLIVGIKLTNRIFGTIKDVSNAAKEISFNNFEATISLPDDDSEVKDLVDSFNQMISRIKNGVNRLDRFNSDVSHELKTPLTVIKGEVEITLRKVRNADYYQRSLQTILYETEQLESIVQNLLALTQYTHETIQQTFVVCHLDALVLDVIEKYEKEATQKSIEIQIDPIEDIQMQGNPILLQRVFSNLLDNALKYSESHTRVNIKLYKKNGIHFSIQDEGFGLSPEQQQQVFERFYRGDVSRNKKIKGFGLGLSIVQNGVALHGGNVQIEAFQSKGTTVHILFPC